jgi:glycogen operon protein
VLEVGDIGWFTPTGSEMSEDDWGAGFAKSLGVFLNGRAIPSPNERGEPILDDSFYLMFNTHREPVEFTLPDDKWGERWTVLLDTTQDKDRLLEQDEGEEVGAGARIRVEAFSLVLLRTLAGPGVLTR